MTNFFEGKKILVTGGVGSIGREIVKKILEYDPKVIRVLDNNETGLFDLQNALHSEKIRLLVGDLRDKERLKIAIEGIDIVIHAAALKHVPLCEFNPFEAVKTNVIGTQNMIDVAREENVEKFITISTDKAVDPVNVMGATKLLAERLTISANLYKGDKRTTFSCVRFGNVLFSRGSVIPVFLEQIKKGYIEITDPNMTRFIMKTSEAVDLILKITEISNGGEIFVLKMPAVKIGDLAAVIIDEYFRENPATPNAVKTNIIGKRPGEKMYEKLLSDDESGFAFENDDMIMICSRSLYRKKTLSYPDALKFKKIRSGDYNSNSVKILSKGEICELIKESLKNSYN